MNSSHLFASVGRGGADTLVFDLGDPDNPKSLGVQDGFISGASFSNCRSPVARHDVAAVDVACDRNGNIYTVQASGDGTIMAADYVRAGFGGMEGDGLFAKERVLRARSPRYDRELRRLVEGAIPAYRSPSTGGSIAVPRVNGGSPLVLHVNPVQWPGTDFRPQGLAAVVLVVDPTRQLRVDLDHVEAVLGLTPSEAEVAVLLAEGRTLLDIAVATGRSRSTSGGT